MTAPAMPQIRGLLETSLYVADPARAAEFYQSLLGFPSMLRTERLIALDAGNAGVLLLFRRGSTSDDIPSPGGMVPGHEGEGRLHLAFAIATDEYEAWRHRITSFGCPILSEVAWPAGGRSVYFKDPDENILELATPGLWPNY
jgi:catechol 2,3-dioxygenase-like lactoylglutathione lyase family enzyme